MPKEWDHLIKRLARANPQHLVSLLMGDAIFEGEAINELQVQSREIQADILYNIKWRSRLAILHAEFQRRHDADIGRRVWEYNVLTECLKQVPVYSFVVYLVKDSGIVQSPYQRILLDGSVSHVFYYTNVYLWELPASIFKGPGREGLLPLLPLTKNGARREVVEEMIEELQAAQRQELLGMAYSFAALVLQREEDRQWLKRRFEMLRGILEDSWAFQEMMQWAEERVRQKEDRARQEAAQKALEQGLQEGHQQGLQEGHQQGLQEGRLAQERETLELCVESRFPALLPLLREQMQSINDLNTLRQLFLNLFRASSEDEARSMILTAHDQFE